MSLAHKRWQRNLFPGDSCCWLGFGPACRYIGNLWMVRSKLFDNLVSIHKNRIFMLSRSLCQLCQQRAYVTTDAAIAIILTEGEQLRIYTYVHSDTSLMAL